MKKVKMYTLSTCLWCKKTKKFFEERKVSYDFVDYDKLDEEEQEKVMAEMEANGGDGSFPYTKIGSTVVNGYDPAEFERLLCEDGKKK